MRIQLYIIYLFAILISTSCKTKIQKDEDWYRGKVEAIWTIDSIYSLGVNVFSIDYRRADFDILTNAFTINKDGTCELPVIVGSNREAGYGNWSVSIRNDSAIMRIIDTNNIFHGNYLLKLYAKKGYPDKMRLISKKMTITCLKVDLPKFQ